MGLGEGSWDKSIFFKKTTESKGEGTLVKRKQFT